MERARAMGIRREGDENQKEEGDESLVSFSRSKKPGSLHVSDPIPLVTNRDRDLFSHENVQPSSL
jgi:hypothetical protein